MLNKMRQNLKALSWILWVTVAAFLLLTFADWGGARDAMRGGATASWVARVNGEPISVADFTDSLRTLDRFYRQIYRDQYDPQALGIVQQALSQLVREQLILEEAHRVGLRVAPDEISRQITQDPSFQENGEFIGSDAYVQFLVDRGIDVEQFEQDIARGLLREKFQRLVTDGLSVSREEVEADYRRRNEKATVEYVLLRAEDYLSSQPADESELQAFYGSRPDGFQSAERRRAAYVRIDPDRLPGVTPVTEEEARAYYEENLDSQYSTPEQIRASHILIRLAADGGLEQEEEARARAQELRDRVAAGEDFAAIAESFSEDETNASLGGDLGFFGRERMVPAFSEAAFALEINQVSELVKTQFGYHVIRLTGRREASTRPFAEVRDPILRQLQFSRSQEALRETVSAFRSAIGADAGEFDQAAATLGLEVMDTGMVERDAPVEGIGDYPQVTQALFSTKVGDTSRAVTLPLGTVFFRVTEVLPPQRLPFEEARLAVEEDHRRHRAIQTARERAEASGAPDLATLARSVDAEVEVKSAITRAQVMEPLGTEGVDLAFRLPEGQLSEALEVDEGLLFIQVVSREGFDPVEFSGRLASLERSLLQQRRDRLFSAVLTQLEAASRVEVNQARLDLYEGRGA